VEYFSWINQNDIKRPEVKTTAGLVIINVGLSPINTDQFFEEAFWVRRFIIYQAGNWENETISCEGNWVRVFKHFNEQKDIPLLNLVEVTEFVFPSLGQQHLHNMCSQL
jgi:hypothetical protein